jgi:ribulose-5-phosphate 4-epimerase/fuculose-1-phosphate aldolase
MKKFNPFIIGISGPSGVGKTTISKLISYLYKKEEVLFLSGDDLHKWERGDIKWKEFTHLNPDANFLNEGYQDLVDLKNGKDIYKRHYNHTTGKFESPKLVKGKPVIIYEGLHTLYGDEILTQLDLKIYVDTDEDLTHDWKLKRDVLLRGYSAEEVEENIKRRKNDNSLYIVPQRKNADVIVKFSKASNDKINLNYELITNKGEKIIEELKSLYSSINDFLNLSKNLSVDLNLVQGKGGNISIKGEDYIVVKSSGANLSEANFSNGFSICSKTGGIPIFNNENEYNEFTKSLFINGDKNPSMEFGFHLSIKDKVVIHTHPIFVNVILCSKNSEELIRKIFSKYDFEFVKYTTPGYKLCNVISNLDKSLIFLENHGLIVGGNDISEALTVTNLINNICQSWVMDNLENYVDVHSISKDSFLFPDSVILPEEIGMINSHILSSILKCSLQPKFLTSAEIDELKNLESEKIRKLKT